MSTKPGEDQCEDEDFKYFNIYRSEDSGFEPGPTDLVHSTADVQWLDTATGGSKFYYKITSLDFSGNESEPSGPDAITGTGARGTPEIFALHQNVPNPFNPVTAIRFDLPVDANVSLGIFNVRGEKVRTLVEHRMTAGRKTVYWNGGGDGGGAVASGVYFYRITAGDFTETRKMVLMR